jgi:WD40 repeat protein
MTRTDVFLTYDWGVDELDRKNHDRVTLIDKAPKAMGIVTWFDPEKMTQELVDQTVSRIDNADVIIVFVTQRYMNKGNGSDANNNCRKEFNYALQKKTSTKMIPVVMEPRMKDIGGNWDDLLQMELGNILYVDFSNDNHFQSAIQQLKAEILSRTNPLWVLKNETPPEVTIKSDNTDRLMIDQLSSWFGSIHISSSVARRYAELLVEKNTSSVINLQDKLEDNSNYLQDIGGFEEKDISAIKEGSKFLIVDSGDQTIVPAEESPAVPQVTSNKKKNSDYPQQKSVPEVLSVAWNHDSSKIVSGSEDTTIKIWNRKKSALATNDINWIVLMTLEGHSGYVLSVYWNHDGNKVVSGSQDKTIKIWDCSAGKVLRTLNVGAITSVCGSHDDCKIVSCSSDKTMRIWNAATGELMKTLKRRSEVVNCAAWSPDNSKIASGYLKEDKIIIWDSFTGQLVDAFLLVSEVQCMAWSSDGSELVCNDGTKIKVYPVDI